jgi:hypothetical protein
MLEVTSFAVKRCKAPIESQEHLQLEPPLFSFRSVKKKAEMDTRFVVVNLF